MAIVVTNAGRAVITNLVSVLGGTVPKWIGMGTGVHTAAVTDTALTTETSDGGRAVGAVTRVTTTVTNDTFQSVGTITASSARAVVESGLFDALTVGNMATSADFAAVNLAIGDSIQFTWKIVFA